MIKQYILLLFMTYIEYFTLWFFFEYKHRITWDGIKFWLKYPPFICFFFFFLIDDWLVATMIYVTFCYPYVLIAYCIKKVNCEIFGINQILINAHWRFTFK